LTARQRTISVRARDIWSRWLSRQDLIFIGTGKDATGIGRTSRGVLQPRTWTTAALAFQTPGRQIAARIRISVRSWWLCMDTSKSSRQEERWIGGAMLFSGRPDPTWNVDPRTMRELESIWTKLPGWSGSAPSAPALGYRGCFVKGPGSGEWFAYEGMVTRTGQDQSESRRDPDRAFEKIILASAPKGLVPQAAIPAALKE
jgi:hypothetical protein